ncbi:Cytochrome P450 2F2 [Cricetulus griseus]|uniref:Cytochrome P450 2F2 n=1 Tax=Cricetulus griseus TaxID=10029 RepID=G3HNR9_CRIGR|nr:Cytochrome P450 2F2 [Cricetulus griseus]
MDGVSTAILLLLLAVISLALSFNSWGKGQLPPGPKPLPFLGNLLQLRSQDLLTSLTKLSKKYGSVYTVYLGPRRVVVLSGYQTVKEALVDKGEEFSGRGSYPVFFNFTKGNGIAFSNGERWKALRRFSVQILRNFGMGKRSIEERILEESSFLLEVLRKTEGKPFDPVFILSRSVSNIICSVIFGSRFDYDDERLLTIIRFINDNFQIMSSPWGEMYNIFPSLLDWLPGPHRRMFRNFRGMKELIARSGREHQDSLDPNSPRDFIDCFLSKMAQGTDVITLLNTVHYDSEQFKTPREFNPEHFLDANQSFKKSPAFAGIVFSNGPRWRTLRNFALGVLKELGVGTRTIEDRILEEAACLLDEFQATMGAPFDPRQLLDNAVSNVICSVVFGKRYNYGDPEFLRLLDLFSDNFRIMSSRWGEGTFVIPLLVSAHRDPTQFKDPDQFNPTNFLDAQGQFQNNDAFMPFAPGKRMCLGAGLARSEIFLFLTAILQKFCLLPVGSPANINLTPQCTGLGNMPPAFQLRLEAR